MAVAISYLFLFGLISCIIGKPLDNSLSGIEGLLKALTQQSGKFDIALSHHEDSPKSHHEDKARISPHDAAPVDESEEIQLTPDVQSIYNLHTKADRVPQLPEASILIEKPPGCTDITKCKNSPLLQLESRILGYLNGDNTENDEDKIELRCANDRCGRDGDSDDSIITVRCAGNRCSTDNDEGDTLRCTNACGTLRDDAPCNQCNINVDELLRCNGNRCGRDENEQDGREDLRCSNNRCSRYREGNVMRCHGKTCSVARHNENNDRNDETQWQPKRVKISENVDAVILDADDLQRLLSGESTRTDQQLSKSLKSMVLENLLNNKKNNIDFILDDIEKRNDKYDLVKEIKRLLTQGSSL